MKKFTVLIVEDEEVIRTMYKDHIESDLFTVVAESEDGQDAYTRFLEHRPDFVITDGQMPFMNGDELTEKIMDRDPEVMVVLVSGNEDIGLQALKNGAKHLLESQRLLYKY